MDELQFRVSAELKNILGRDLITSDNIAILELVKNSYDAHATKVEITILSDKIKIADNGKGMTLDDVINKWLFVAYSAKKDGSEDASYRSQFNRHYAGAKGIGRLSCDCLAVNLKMTTKSAESSTAEVLYVDWSVFENNQLKEFDEIAIPHESSNEPIKFPNNSTTGTILEFSDLRSSWGRQEILSLKKSLEKMINPFSGVDNFQIEIIAPNFREQDEIIRSEVDEAKHNYETLDDKSKGKITRRESEIVNGLIRNSISDVLKLKTTKIECVLKDGRIKTELSDRGVLMYSIEESNTFDLLENVSVNLFYLNRAAKYSFSVSMGVTPVSYGNVFLFRNGFRILPYGNERDDSWKLDQRAQQGYNRYLGTRDLFGRVDVETNHIDNFKEVSSRDGGLIESPAKKQLFSFFYKVHHRLERYVSGVLWGEGFVRKDYFKHKKDALDLRDKLQGIEKDSENISHIYENIGSKVDFLQLIKSLVNDDAIDVHYYNEGLADIVSDASIIEIIQTQMVDDFRKIAEQSADQSLKNKLITFERQVEEIRHKAQEAERRAEEERKKAELARKKAEEEKTRRLEEEERRKKAESELEDRKKQNLFLQSLGTLDNERIIKYHHDIRLQSLTIQNFLSRIAKNIRNDNLDKDKLSKNIELIAKANARVISIAQFATKANFNTTGDIIQADLVRFVNDYITEVLPAFYGETHLTCDINDCVFERSFRPLELSLLIDNLLSNSLKQNATTFKVVFENKDGVLEMDIIDDGTGLASSVKTPSDIFQKGYTTTNGSGLGLYSSAEFVNKELGGEMSCDDAFNYSSNKKGFKLIIKLPL